MGSSSSSDYSSGVTAPSGPPISELQPATAAPAYTSFLPTTAGTPATGLTQAMLDQLYAKPQMNSAGAGMTASGVPPRMAPPSSMSGSGMPASRDELAQMMSEQIIADAAAAAQASKMENINRGGRSGR